MVDSLLAQTVEDNRILGRQMVFLIMDNMAREAGVTAYEPRYVRQVREDNMKAALRNLCERYEIGD